MSSLASSISSSTEEAAKPKIVILISGSGSNMVAIADQVKSAVIDAEIAAVISNRPDAAGIQKAKDRDIPTAVIDHTQFDSREAFDATLIRTISEYQPDLVVLAGFMRILTPDFVTYFSGQLLNIHPSLLPKYQGLNTHQRALDAGDHEHGVTVHFVTAELDGGPNIIQAVVPLYDGDDAQSVQKRVQQQEHVIFPIAVKWFIEGRLSMLALDDQQYIAEFDGQALPTSGLRLN